jgi:hypothetical protein
VTPRAFPRPTDLEILASMLLGRDDEAPALPAAAPETALEALHRVVRGALLRAPCVVSFSGGRDSSAILALAHHVARVEGLEPPVPVMLRYPEARDTDETEWQQLVIQHLGSLEPVVIEVGQELDLLGETAVRCLLRHGVRWPANAYMSEPVLAVARGGTMLTGIGGDELLGTRASRHVRLLRRADTPKRGDVRTFAAAMLPRPVAAARRRRRTEPFRWLTATGNERTARAFVREELEWPHRWDRAVAHWHGTRAFSAVNAALGVLGQHHDSRVVHPFLDPVVMRALMREGGPTGFPGRTAAMRRLFGHLLPEQVIARETKAVFSEPLWGPATRTFAQDWDGAGVDPRDVDANALRREWLAPTPDFRSALLLHRIWASTAELPPNGIVP